MRPMRFDVAELDLLAETYVVNSAAAGPAHHLERIVRYDAENGWLLARTLVARAPNEELLLKIASFGSPLETLLASHGAAVIDRVEEAARDDVRLRTCLERIRSIFGRIPDAILIRVRRAAGVPWLPDPGGVAALAASMPELETYATVDVCPPGPADLDALRAPLDTEEVDRLVAAWFTYVETFWAFEETQQVAGMPLDLAWLFLRRLVHDGTDDVLGAVAAGPMEDFLSFRDADAIDRVERAARRDGRLRTCLAGVWKAGMSDAVWERVVRAAAFVTLKAT